MFLSGSSKTSYPVSVRGPGYIFSFRRVDFEFNVLVLECIPFCYVFNYGAILGRDEDDIDIILLNVLGQDSDNIP